MQSGAALLHTVTPMSVRFSANSRMARCGRTRKLSMNWWIGGVQNHAPETVPVQSYDIEVDEDNHEAGGLQVGDSAVEAQLYSALKAERLGSAPA